MGGVGVDVAGTRPGQRSRSSAFDIASTISSIWSVLTMSGGERQIGIPRHPYEHSVFEAVEKDVECPGAGGAVARLQLHGAHEPDVPHVDHVRLLDRGGARRRPSTTTAPRPGRTVSRVRTDRAWPGPPRRPAGVPSTCIRGRVRCRRRDASITASWISVRTATAPIGTAAFVTPLAMAMRSGRDAEELGAEGSAEPAEPGDHFVEDEEDSVLVADVAQPLEVAPGRDQNARGAGHRFDDHGGDGIRAALVDDRLRARWPGGRPTPAARG